MLALVPEAHRSRLLTSLGYCMHEARGKDVNLDCDMTMLGGIVGTFHLTLHCKPTASGAVIVGVHRNLI